MARKLNPRKKGKDVAKFGGNEELGRVKMDGHDHEAISVEVQSQTKFEQDQGYGNTVAIRCFIFGMNPQAFELARPTKQEIFNSHLKGIELSLWGDGWQVYTESAPRVVLEPEKMRYLIYVPAIPMKGRILSYTQTPHTLGDLVNG